MSVITPKHLVERQLPSYVRESNPLFGKFLEYYYEFVENSKIPDIIQEIRKYNDIDEVEEQFLLDFFEEFKTIPKNIVADRRLVAKHIYDLYKSKGSEASLKLLFKIVYGEEIGITYPSEDILRASDGRWVQDNIITIQSIEGAISSTSNRISFKNVQGDFLFEIKRFEAINANTIRVIFEPTGPYVIDTDQLIEVYTNETLDFLGRAVLMPSFVEVETGGAAWQLGQIIILPGTVKDTICQVKRIGADGSITRLDIVDYGIGYSTDTVFTVSPYRFKPAASYIEQYTEKLSDSPATYAHTVNIFDTNEGIAENIVGRDSNQEYVLEGYTIPDYINRIAFVEDTFVEDNDVGPVNESITIEQWVASRARIRIRNRFFAKAAGYYQDFKGQLSVPNIRLQDNFFYQIFSYVIETSRQVSEYKNVISIVHPAGVKYFANLTKTANVQVSVSASRILSRETILLLDEMGVDDAVAKDAILSKSDTATSTDIDANSNYDANNEPAFYDENSDEWDAITQTYDAQDFDLENYGQENEQYTLEDPLIVITKS